MPLAAARKRCRLAYHRFRQTPYVQPSSFRLNRPLHKGLQPFLEKIDIRLKEWVIPNAAVVTRKKLFYANSRQRLADDVRERSRIARV